MHERPVLEFAHGQSVLFIHENENPPLGSGADHEAEELAEAAHKVCPYSKATRGNIDVKLNPQAI